MAHPAAIAVNDAARAALAVLLLALCCTASAQPHWRIEDVDRFVAVADIHGAYDAFETILRAAGIIDDSLDWAGGTDHLVIVGDVLDRGPESRRALELIMRLEPAAAAAGGAVHFVLGNHELMNLTGDLRYVAEAEYAAFAADETEAMRQAAFEQLAAAGRLSPDEPGARDVFDARFPAGYFAHRQAFTANGELGAWLLDQPFLLSIDDWAFVHAGLAEAAGALVPDDLNTTLGRQLRDYTAALNSLTAAGILTPDIGFFEHPAALAAFGERVEAGVAEWPPDTEAAAGVITALHTALAFDVGSPAWYRGNVGCSRLIETDRLAATLTAAGVSRLVVGHTPTYDAMVQTHLDRQLFRIDTGMLNAYYGGRAAALIVEGDEVRALYEDGSTALEIEPQPRRVGARPNGMTAAALEDFLSTAEILGVTDLDGRWSHVALRLGDIELGARFTPDPAKGVQPDLAAFMLDRELGLDMVPVTVSREVDGQPGTLQYLPPITISEAERQAGAAPPGAWCPLGDQFGAMYIFDALIANMGRTADRILYSSDNGQVILVGHDASLSTQRTKPDHLAELTLPLTPAWIEQLRALDAAGLEQTLAGVLDRRRIRALIARRDQILEDAGVTP